MLNVDFADQFTKWKCQILATALQLIDFVPVEENAKSPKRVNAESPSLARLDAFLLKTLNIFNFKT